MLVICELWTNKYDNCSLWCPGDQADDAPHRVQTHDIPGAEGLRGPGHSDQTGQAVLPGHHRPVRDEAAQLSHHAREHGEVRWPADVGAHGDQDLPGLDGVRLWDVCDHSGGPRHPPGARGGPGHAHLAPEAGPGLRPPSRRLLQFLFNLNWIPRNYLRELLLIPRWKQEFPSHCFSQ